MRQRQRQGAEAAAAAAAEAIKIEMETEKGIEIELGMCATNVSSSDVSSCDARWRIAPLLASVAP